MGLTNKIPVSRWDGEKSNISTDELARESLITLQYNGEIIANLLGTPANHIDLILGHLLCEGFIPESDLKEELIFSEEETDSGSHIVSLTGEYLSTKARVQRDIVTSSCGACNTDGLDELLANLPFVEKDLSGIDFPSLNNVFKKMKTFQFGFSSSGGMHAAGLIDFEYELLCVMEDIGRHNAVDKVIGSALIKKLDLSKTYLLLSGRCGWDIVAKASRSGVRNIVCIGACSSLAAQTARIVGIRIISFLKENNAVIIGHN